MSDRAKIIPAILCGGVGARLWPYSRAGREKPFLTLDGKTSALGRTLSRIKGAHYEPPLLLISAEQAERAQEVARLHDVTPVLLCEPKRKGTAAAILWSALHVARAYGDNALVLAMPADLAFEDETGVTDAITVAAEAAETGRICTFGISARAPHEGFGYLCPKDGERHGVFALSRFVEKPSRGEAARLIAQQKALWNAGMFLARADAFIKAYHHYLPALFESVSVSFASAEHNCRVWHAGGRWHDAQAGSIDSLLIERLQDLQAVHIQGGWCDLGHFDALHQMMDRDGANNAQIGAATLKNTRGCLALVDGGPPVTIENVSDLAVVSTDEAILVRPLGGSEGTLIHEPWGQHEVLGSGERYKLKRLTVLAGEALSLQRHQQRDEHWVVVCGEVVATLGDTQRVLKTNEGCHVAAGLAHRLENRGPGPAILIEIQTGETLSESDIIREDDLYGRA